MSSVIILIKKCSWQYEIYSAKQQEAKKWCWWERLTTPNRKSLHMSTDSPRKSTSFQESYYSRKSISGLENLISFLLGLLGLRFFHIATEFPHINKRFQAIPSKRIKDLIFKYEHQEKAHFVYFYKLHVLVNFFLPQIHSDFWVYSNPKRQKLGYLLN